MNAEGDQVRHSRAATAELIADPDERARAEARNGLRQFDLVKEIVLDRTSPEKPFKLRMSMLLALHRTALEGISSYAGNFRPAGVEIEGSRHQPPGAHLVPEHVEQLCDYVNDNWSRPPVHLAAYVMWRLNWIHPFDDGNGRTSRAASYMVLCARAGHWLPGRDTIPEQISRNKRPYYDALEAADVAWSAGRLDLSAMENLLGDMLANQLVNFHGSATGMNDAKQPT